ncbi:MAG TPA: hypothetical protein DHU96_23325 [Actinobacteria bacterium]|nr:hypothetical protein [Actinomycetota bacterium]
MVLGLLPGERALVIAAWPGDETFGMGGTITAMAVHGITVDVLAVAFCDRCDFRWTIPGKTMATWPPEFVERSCGRPAPQATP